MAVLLIEIVTEVLKSTRIQQISSDLGFVSNILGFPTIICDYICDVSCKILS